MHPSMGSRATVALALLIALTVLTLGGCQRGAPPVTETTARPAPRTARTVHSPAAACPPAAPDASPPVYYLVDSVAERQALEATLAAARPIDAPLPAACIADRVILVEPEMDLERTLFPLTAINHRRLDEGQPPITVVDRRPPPPD